LLAGGGTAAAEAIARERDPAVRALQQLGQPDALLRLITLDAGAMHPSFVAGTIAPGALANLTVWHLDSPAFWPAADPLRALALGDIAQSLRQHLILGRPLLTEGNALDALLQSPDYPTTATPTPKPTAAYNSCVPAQGSEKVAPSILRRRSRGRDRGRATQLS
jgi:hypothetical protein